MIKRSSMALCFLLFSPSLCLHAQTRTPVKIRVYIIGVVDFQIQELNVPGLKDAVTLECNDIEGYFNDRFGANVEVKKHCTSEETTRESIRRYLSVDLRNGGADDLNFVFLMSHGMPINYRNQFLSTDVDIITSDTKKGDEEFTSISAATELLPWLQKLSTRSTTILFLDVCYAGNAENLSTKLAGSLQDIFGIKNLVVASSLAKDKSYQAAFTAAVMGIIRGNECVPAQDLDRKIAATVQGFTAAKLNGTEGLPDVIVPYVGSLCLGNMGEDGKLLFVYTGQEPKTTKYRIAGAASNSVEGPTYIQNPFFTRRENSDKYTLYIQRTGELEKPVKTIDLTATDFDVAWVDGNVNYKGAAEFLQKAAVISQFNANSAVTSATLRLGAAGLYRAHNDIANYKRVLNSVPADVRNLLIAPKVFAAAFHDDAVQKLLQAPGADPTKLASQLALIGDFKNAATVAKVAVEKQTDIASKQKAQETEYLFLAASGNLGAAKNVRLQSDAAIGVSDPALVLAEKAATASNIANIKSVFQDLSSISAISRASGSIASGSVASATIPH
jgi:hypothetical protein